ncbi:MAG: hypothetical protein CVU05_07140 [Bacteroidetes bacterium HGW-Bacteroidetes-21]|jgi:hypothetical protein|nr:MAG: hypothetical protein CVU05_07140 [Bacteroidetes bacterium HGW-Bacteroidetes-21]
MRTFTILIFSLIAAISASFAQPVPTVEMNIPYLVTFGGQSDKSWGDDDFCQIFFFVVPTTQLNPVFIRVYDPECSGDIDEPKGEYNTKTRYSVYGGKESFSNVDARLTDPKGNYKSGNLLASKVFYNETKYDKQWYTFGPFNPTEGELKPEYGGYLFKFIIEGSSGDDGNLYKLFLSTKQDANIPVEGGNAFTYEYTFRMWDDPSKVSHIYPYVDDKVISVKISNFDWDNDGMIRIVSVAKNGEKSLISKDNEWVSKDHKIVESEKNTSLDIQFIKNKSAPAKNNNVVIYVRNQYDELLPFYVIPIGGIPKYNYKINVTPKK